MGPDYRRIGIYASAAQAERYWRINKSGVDGYWLGLHWIDGCPPLPEWLAMHGFDPRPDYPEPRITKGEEP